MKGILSIVFIIFYLNINLIEGKKENIIYDEYDGDNLQKNNRNGHEKNMKNMQYAIPVTNPNYATDGYCYWDGTAQMYRIRSNYYYYWNGGWSFFLWFLFLILIFFGIILCFPCWDYEGYYYQYRPYTWGWRTMRTTKYTANRLYDQYNQKKRQQQNNYISSFSSPFKKYRHSSYNYYI